MADAQSGVSGDYRPTPDMAGVSPAPPPGPHGSYWGYPPPAQRAKKWTAVGVVVAILIGLAALTVGIVALVTRPAPSGVSAPPPNQPAAAPSDTTEADTALCMAIKPLMAEDDDRSNAWINTGEPGSPARDAALPDFRKYTEDWAGRMQDEVEANPGAHPFFLRTLQRFIDDRVLLVRNMRPGPAVNYDKHAWSDSMTAYGGALSICGALGIKW